MVSHLYHLDDQQSASVLLMSLVGVTQVDIMEAEQILIVLADRILYSFAYDRLDLQTPLDNLAQGRRISVKADSFKIGICIGKPYICIAKSSPTSTTVRVMEPITHAQRLHNRGNDVVRVYKEFYLPVVSTSIHFLKTKLCIANKKEFQIVDLESLNAQPLLQQTDRSLDSIQQIQDAKPIAIYRIGGEFLLCYDKFAFYIDKNGSRSRGDWIIHWNGSSTSFALQRPYIVAFQTNRIEIYHITSGSLHQVILGDDIRLLTADIVIADGSSPIIYAKGSAMYRLKAMQL